HLGVVDRSRALEEAALGNLDLVAILQIGLDAAFDDELVAGGDLARERDLAADDQAAQVAVAVASRLDLRLRRRLGQAARRRLGGTNRLGQGAGQLGSARRHRRRYPRYGGNGGGLAWRPGRLHRDAQIVGSICWHLAVLVLWSFAAEHG